MDWTIVTDWLLQHGIRILIIVVVGVVLWILLKRVMPPALRKTLSETMKGESQDSIKKRTDTLLMVFVGARRIIIFLIIPQSGFQWLIVSDRYLPLPMRVHRTGCGGIRSAPPDR